MIGDAEERAHGGIVQIDGTIATLGDGSRWWLNSPIATRPQDWSPIARAILFPDRVRQTNR